jgi:predicted DNA-binding transcriptional regulator AlpA
MMDKALDDQAGQRLTVRPVAALPAGWEEVKPGVDRLWTVEEVSHFLGVPVATLYRWRYLGTGPKAGRVGRHLRYLPADVLSWFRKQQAA